MFTQVAPSGVVVHSETPFKKYGFRDKHLVPFAMWSYSFTAKRIYGQYVALFKELMAR